MDGQKFLIDSRDKANLLNKFFQSVFSPTSTMHQTRTQSPSISEKLDSIQLTVGEVTVVLLGLDPNKACGPDNIPHTLLKKAAVEIAPSLCKLFNISLSLGVVPAQWKHANVFPVFKKDDPTLAGTIDQSRCFASFPKSWSNALPYSIICNPYSIIYSMAS